MAEYDGGLVCVLSRCLYGVLALAMQASAVAILDPDRESINLGLRSVS